MKARILLIMLLLLIPLVSAETYITDSYMNIDTINKDTLDFNNFTGNVSIGGWLNVTGNINATELTLTDDINAVNGYFSNDVNVTGDLYANEIYGNGADINFYVDNAQGYNFKIFDGSSYRDIFTLSTSGGANFISRDITTLGDLYVDNADFTGDLTVSGDIRTTTSDGNMVFKNHDISTLNEYGYVFQSISGLDSYNTLLDLDYMHGANFQNLDITTTGNIEGNELTLTDDVNAVNGYFSNNVTIDGNLSVGGNFDLGDTDITANTITTTNITADNFNLNGTSVSDTFVNTTGDTMTGDLNMGTNDILNITKLTFDDSQVNIGSGTSTGLKSIAIGTNADEDYEISIGFNAQGGDRAVALGILSGASGKYSFGMGYNANSNGENSIAIGGGTIGTAGALANSSDTIAFGRTSIASGVESIAIGHDAEATNSKAIAIGDSAEASGDNSPTAVGERATASGNYATAYGANARATGTSNVAVGYNTETTGFGSTAIGTSATTTGSSAFAMGYLSEASTGAIAGGSSSYANSYSVALGQLANASALYSVALGRDTDATGQYSIAIGSGNDGTSNEGADATGTYSTAIGWNTTATATGSVSIGANTKNSEAYTFKIGGDMTNTLFDTDLNVTGNITGNNWYGGMFYHNDTATALSFAVDGEFYYLFMQNVTHLNGFTANNIGLGLNSSLTTQVAGTYRVSFMTTGSGENNHLYHTSIFVNEDNQLQCDHIHKMTAGGDILTQTGICFIDLEVGQNVSVRTANVGATGSGNYYGANLNLLRVGN